MCVIAVYEDNYPELADLESMESMNNDGSGFAWIEGKKVHYKKGINQSAKDIYNYIQEKQLKLPIIIHFRIKSSGLICDELCHPFPISNKSSDSLDYLTDKVLFHNGTVYKWSDYLLETCIKSGLKIPDGELSDSKALAFLCSVYGDNFLRVIDSTSRFLVFSKDGIKKYGEWIKVNNIECSNNNHVKETKSYGYHWNDEFKKKTPELIQNDSKEDKEEKVSVNNTNLINVWKNGQLIRIERKDGSIVSDLDKQNELNSEIEIMSQIDSLKIESMNEDQLKDLHTKTCLTLDKIENKIIVLKSNMKEYNKLGFHKKLVKKIRSTRNRIKKLEDEKLYFITILDDIMQNSNDPDLQYEDNYLI